METKIGSFSYDGLYMTPPVTARLHANAPVDSPFAVEQLTQLCRDNKGLNEIVEISSGQDERKKASYLLLIFADSVVRADQAKKLAINFMSAVQTYVEEFDDLDIARWRYAARSGRLFDRDVYAISSEVTTYVGNEA